MRERFRQILTGVLLTQCAVLAGAGSPALADVEYNAISLLNAPQPADDAAQLRPGLDLHRPAIGSINNLGQLAGAGDAGANLLPRDARPFFYDPAQHTAANLGDLTGDFASQDASPRNDLSRAMDLNDAGWVVGLSSTSTLIGDVADDRPFLWFDDDANLANTPGEMHQLGLNPGATYGSALRVNNSNQALIQGDSGLYRADLVLNAGVVLEPAPRSFITGSADLADMNDFGDVAFVAGNASFVWRDLNGNNAADPGETAQVPFMSAASPNAAVFGINNAGQVVGTMRNDNNRDIGFIWTDLDDDNQFDWADTNNNGIFEWDETSDEISRFHGNPNGINATTGSTFVFDINDRGQAVGGFFDSSNRKGFIYDTVTGMRFLDGLVDPAFPLNLREADAINNAGVISAVGRAPGSSTDQLVLITPFPAAIPGDLDGDGFVGINDLNLVLGNWNQNVPPGDPLADPSGDGFVGIEDLNLVLGNWNTGTPPGGSPNTIPEPGSLALLGAGYMTLMRRSADKR